MINKVYLALPKPWAESNVMDALNQHQRCSTKVIKSRNLGSNNALSHSCRGKKSIHRIHKWRTRGKKLVPSHESEALEGKLKLQMKTFSELAECLARIPPKITLYGLLFKYNTWDVSCF